MMSAVYAVEVWLVGGPANGRVQLVETDETGLMPDRHAADDIRANSAHLSEFCAMSSLARSGSVPRPCMFGRSRPGRGRR
jgi:hypothetical protein